MGKTAERHTSAEFVAFLTDIVASQTANKEIHIILDNLSAHKTDRVKGFLADHPQRDRVKKIVAVLVDSLREIRSEKSVVVSYIQKKWKLPPKIAGRVYRSFLDLIPEGGKISLSCINDYLASQLQGKGISRLADTKSVADFSLLDEIHAGR